MRPALSFSRLALLAVFALLVPLTSFMSSTVRANAQATSNTRLGAAFEQASSEFEVPAPLLKALCYMEGRLSDHGGRPSVDHGFGCMHLIQNQRGDTLDQAASILGVSTDQLKTDIATNILGGAAVLRAEAEQLSSTHTLPTTLAEWYGAVAEYSHAEVRSTALMYADALYTVLNTGFSAPGETGETVTLAPQAVQPDTATAAGVMGTSSQPTGCSNTPTGDYPLAVNCILDPTIFDCTPPAAVYPPCSYEERTDAPYPLPVDFVVIHDTEGSLQSALNTFQNTDPKTAPGASANYIVDTDGTVYQVVHDADFPYNCGNYWYNQHSVGIEHVGFAATGSLWYNAAEYLGSAKLVAYLLNKYHLPLSRNDIVAHGTVPSSTYTSGPNHVDPGPYWMWDYYFSLIHQQGIPYPQETLAQGTIELHTGMKLGQGGTESPGNFNFYYLYNGPSTASGLIPQMNSPSDVTDETNNIEADISYPYLAIRQDPVGTGDTMYEISYGESDQAHNSPPSLFEDGKPVWLAVPPGANVTVGTGTLVRVKESSVSQVLVYGNPNPSHIIGGVPNGALFDSGYTLVQDGTTTLWYEINFNHRQGWIPASEVTVIPTT